MALCQGFGSCEYVVVAMALICVNLRWVKEQTSVFSGLTCVNLQLNKAIALPNPKIQNEIW